MRLRNLLSPSKKANLSKTAISTLAKKLEILRIELSWNSMCLIFVLHFFSECDFFKGLFFHSEEKIYIEIDPRQKLRQTITTFEEFWIILNSPPDLCNPMILTVIKNKSIYF